MAIVTKTIGGFGDGITFQVDYDDVNLRLTALRCINISNRNAWVKLTKISNGRSAEGIFLANQTQVVTIPTVSATRIAITIDTRGRIDGCNFWLMDN